jgi:argininosuccinate lyase
MNDTGRIRAPLHRRIRQIVFGDQVDEASLEEIEYLIRIDQAHVVMLVESGLLPRDSGRRLLQVAGELAETGCEALRGRSAPRGAYLLYEQYLVERLGDVGGCVHLGRSRNDINATLVRLRMRGRYRRLSCEVLRLLAVLIRKAERHQSVEMPLYTHYRAAVPITFGHYLAGVALALLRDLQGLRDAAADLRVCPLGAGAGGGTSVPINPSRTATLLGFECGVLHSVDAVASRDLVLRVLSTASILGVTLGRVATDLQLWSTSEFDLIRFPDHLVGSSSMMPQKRNAFVLEHIHGRAGAALGAFTAAAMAMHGTAYSNSVAVGTEGVKPAWRALDEVAEAVALAGLMIRGGEPCSPNMRRLAEESDTLATELANRLVLSTGMPFRQAHHEIGSAITAGRGGLSTQDHGKALFTSHKVAFDPEWLDLVQVVASTRHGGGPAQITLRQTLARLRKAWKKAASELRAQEGVWREGEQKLALAAAAVTGETISSAVVLSARCESDLP